MTTRERPPFHNGSYWFDTLDNLEAPVPPATLPDSVDVAIVGGGYTGLWTAYYLSRENPALKIAVFESVTVGFGASGRNGGWCMGLAWGIADMLATPARRERGLDLLRAMHETVDEVGRVCQAENIDCHYAKGGTLNVATTPVAVEKMTARVRAYHDMGFDEGDYEWLPAAQARERVNTSVNHGAVYTPHCAAIHPARLVRGLAEVVERMGVDVYEGVPVLEIGHRRIETALGGVQAEIIVRATEGYSDSLPSTLRWRAR